MYIPFPEALGAYLKGLLCVSERATATALARIIRGTAHDRFTRILRDKRLDWQTLLSSLALGITGKLNKGYLIIDDTIIDKAFARAIEGVAWVYSSKEQRSILGLAVVVLVWSNGTLTIPLGIRVWKKGGKSKVTLAIDLLVWAKKFLKIKPRFVVFDSWYAAGSVLKIITEFGWTWVSQLKRNRKLNNLSLGALKKNPYWIMNGRLSGGHEVVVVRHGKKYFVTSNHSWSKDQILLAYRSRWPIETMFRVLHSELGVDECQARSLVSQHAHLHLCLMAYTMLAHESYFTKRTCYAMRREYRFAPEKADLLITKLIFQGA